MGPAPGNVAGITVAVPLPETLSLPKRLIAGEAHDADRLRRRLAGRRVTAVIPSTATRTAPYPPNRRARRPRNQVGHPAAARDAPGRAWQDRGDQEPAMPEYTLVDPELRPLLDAWPTVELRAGLLDALRSNAARLPAPPVAANSVRVDERRVPGPPGAPEVALRVYTPDGEGPFPCLYHIHGGGYVLGDAASLEYAHRPMAEELGCVVVSADYRLAPETVFPGAVEDCYAGLAWVVHHAGELGVDPARIGVTGESAGGGLAAALALLVRDRGEYRLAFQNLVYPMIDDRTCTAADPHPHTGAFIWTPHNNRFGWQALLGAEPGGPGVSPYAAAARATDLAGLPPTYISTGALDLFLEEDLDYARRLTRAGVPTELHVYPGAVHGFERHPTAAVSRQARRDRMDALRRAMA